MKSVADKTASMNRPDEIAALSNGMTCYERDEDLCEDQMCLRTGCRLRNTRLSVTSPSDAVREALIDALTVRADDTRDDNKRILDALRILRATPAALAPAEKARDSDKPASWTVPTETVADLISNLRTVDPALKVHGAYHIDTPNDRCRARNVSMSLERVSGNRIRTGDETVPYSLVIWTQPDLATTPTPPSADVALLRHLSGCARAFLQHFNPCDLAEDKAQQWQALEHQCDLADAAIQSAAHDGGTKSDGACLSSLPSGESEPLVTAASAPSDPAQEPQAVALKPCPFCGSHYLTLTVNGTNWQVVQCDNCGASGPCVDLEGFQYIERWNTRPVSLDREAIEQIIDPTAQGDYRRSERQHKADAIIALIEGRT